MDIRAISKVSVAPCNKRIKFEPMKKISITAPFFYRTFQVVKTQMTKAKAPQDSLR